MALETQLPDWVKTFRNFQDGKFEYEGVVMMSISSPAIMEQVKTFQVREDDVIIVDYPKCGMHWMQEIVLQMRADGHVVRIERDLSCIGALETKTTPYLERPFMEGLESKPSPRLYLSHLPAQLLPRQVWTKKPKVIYLTRNPKDAWTSLYRFNLANPLDKAPITWDEIFNLTISGKAAYGDFFDHSLSYWQHRDDDHVFFMAYEEAKQDIRSVIRRLETFLGLSISPEGLERIVENTTVEGMRKIFDDIERKNPEKGKQYTRFFGLKPYIQTGVTGNWKAQFTEEQSDRVDKIMRERLSGTGLDDFFYSKGVMDNKNT